MSSVARLSQTQSAAGSAVPHHYASKTKSKRKRKGVYVKKGRQGPKPTFPWTRAQEEGLIDWWRANECLYNFRSDGYFNRTLRERLYAEKAREIGNGCSAEDVVTRLRSLRTKINHMLIQGTCEGGGQPRTHLERWVWDRLDFLRPFMSHRKTTRISKKPEPKRPRGRPKKKTGVKHQGLGNFPSGHRAADTSVLTKRAQVTILRPKREPEQPDWSVVDVSVDDELGWEMEDKENSVSIQQDQRVESQQNLVTPSYPQNHVGPSGQGSARGDAHDSQSKLSSGTGGVTSPQLSDAVPSTPVSSEDQDLGYCFTCQDPLLVDDLERRSLLATQNNMKLLHALRQMCWPGLYNPHCNFRTLTCCGDCVQLIHEYIEAMKTLSALKGCWLQRTGHNSAPHSNPFHEEVFTTRDSIVDIPRRNLATSRLQRMDEHVQVSSPRQVRPVSVHPQISGPRQVNHLPPVSEYQQTSVLHQVSIPHHDSDICSVSEPTGVHDHQSLDDYHQVINLDQLIDPHQVSVSDSDEMGRAERGGSLGQTNSITEPYTLQETSRNDPLTQQGPPTHQLSHSEAADPQLIMNGRSVAGNRGPSNRVKEPEGGTGDLQPSHPMVVTEIVDNSLPQSVDSTFQDQPTENEQNGGFHQRDYDRRRADHNFDSIQDNMPMAIKEEAQVFYDEPPSLPMETLAPDNRWGSDEGR